MNRRSILSTLCTAALALLAPVVAWAGRRKCNRPHVGLTHAWRVCDLQNENASLRALLAEARDALSRHYGVYSKPNEPPCLVRRIDAVLKEKV